MKYDSQLCESDLRKDCMDENTELCGILVASKVLLPGSTTEYDDADVETWTILGSLKIPIIPATCLKSSWR